MDIKNYIEGNWHLLKGSLKAAFGKITDDEWSENEGNMEKLLGTLQKSYSIEKDEAEKMVNEFIEGHLESNRKYN